ncbi:MAG: hypothetical protein KA059_05780 [Elusimicrobiales bacterium]|jgi:hypothetical protein|nr:hypothetical protein [Elusimicrobiales bacterium]
MIRIFLILMITVFSPLSAQNWQRVETKHFDIYFEGKWEIPSFSMEMERIYNLMNLNLSYFAPWMSKEKTSIYIYSRYDTYIKGEFKPPEWSKGLALFEKKTIVVYNSDKQDSLIPTITHELTHLYFESYFRQKSKKPPLWLNEGLAVYMEDLSSKSNEGEWYRALKYSPKKVYMKFDVFFDTELNSLKDDKDIANWYLEAYGIVKYLYSPSRKIIFYRFCSDILKGKKLEKALWNNYRINNLKSFEKKWFYWLDSEIINHDGKNDSFEFKPFKTIEFTTH